MDDFDESVPSYTEAALRGGAVRGHGCPGAGCLGGAVVKGSAAAKARMAYLRSLRGKKGSSGARKTRRMKGGINPLMLVGPAITGARLLYKLIKHIRDKKKAKQEAVSNDNEAIAKANSGGFSLYDFEKRKQAPPELLGLMNNPWKIGATRRVGATKNKGSGILDRLVPGAMNPLNVLRYMV